MTSWTSGSILGAFAAAAILLVAFIWWERRVPEPMLDLSFVEDRRFSLGCISIFGAFLCLFGVYFLVRQYLPEVRGYSPLEAGIYALPAGIAQLVVAPMSAHVVERVGYRAVMGTGLLLVSGGTLMLAFMSLSSPLWLLFLGLAILGAGLGAATPPATVSAPRSRSPAAFPDAPARCSRTPPATRSPRGMLRAFTAGAALSFLAAVVVFRYLPKGLRPRDDDPDAAPPSAEDVREPQEAVSRA